MLKNVRVGIVLLAVLGLVLPVVGCGGLGGERLVVIRGKLVENGQPVKAGGPYEGEGPEISVTFYPVDAAGNPAKDRQPWSCTVRPDGTFVMDGAGKGIPAGRYKILIQGQPAPGTPGAEEAARAMGGDVFKGRFNLQNTPFVYEFTSNQEITLELGTAAGGSEQGS